ncbi:MAG: glycosyltransferase, partial [Alkalispirochaetaceae bacterium]
EPAGAPGRGAPGDAATGPGGGIGRGAPGTGDGAGRRLDIVHSHSPFVAGKLAGRTAARYGAVHVTTFHSKYRDDFLRSIPFEAAADLFVSRLVRFYEAADAVWAPSEATAETLRSYGFSGEVEVMPNGADLEPPSSEAYGEYRRRGAQLLGLREEQPFVLLFVGQHRWEKNLRLIIDSLAELSGERARAFRMVFAGTGADLGEIRRYAGRRGVGELCDFRGLVLDREELKALYARAELFLFPSLYDNAPLVLREAAAFRTPALLASGSTAAGDTRDGRNAFHCEARPEALSSLLGRLLGDRELLRRVGEAARREVYRSWEGIVEEVAARYEALLQ